MNRGHLINFVDFLINSYESGLTNVNIVKSLVESISYRKVGKMIEDDVINKKFPLSLAIKNTGLFPVYFPYVLEAAEKSGQFVEILTVLKRILENQEKIDNETKGYKFYFLFLCLLLVIGVLIFHFIFNKVVLQVVEDKSGQFWKFLELVHGILSPINVAVLVSVLLILAILLMFRNPFLDIVEYYVFGKPYREVVFSQLMSIWGNLLSAGISIPVSLYIAVSTIENNYFRNFLLSNFRNFTNNFTQVDNSIIKKIYSFWPKEYQLILENSFKTGVMDRELLKVSDKLFEKSSKDLKRRIMIVIVSVVVLEMLLLGGIIVITSLSIYLPLMEGIN